MLFKEKIEIGILILCIIIMIEGFLTVYLLWVMGNQLWQIERRLPPEPSVTVVTDKKEYKQGEIIKITIRNGLYSPIWYPDFGYQTQTDVGCYSFWASAKEGESGRFFFPVFIEGEEKCIPCAQETKTLEEVLKKIEPDSEVTIVWSQKICEDSSLIFIRTGNHVLSMVYGFSKENFESHQTAIFTNEFTIEKK